MRFLVRWAFRGFLVLIALGVAAVLIKDALLKAIAESQLRAQTGMDVKIGRLETGLFRPTLSVEDLTLYNRPEFGGSPFLVMPDLHVEWDGWALLSRRLHFRLVRVAVSEINVVEARDGRSNFPMNFEDPGIRVPLPAPGSRPILGLDFGGIDTLNLTLHQVRYTNLRNPRKNARVKLDLHNEIIQNVRSMADLTNLLMKVSLRKGVTISGGV
jgi:hypothetical protein